MLFILALAIGVVVGAMCLAAARDHFRSTLVRACAAVAGFIIGYAGTYLVVANI